MHQVAAFIVRQGDAESACAADARLKAIPMPQDLAIIPLPYEFLEEVVGVDLGEMSEEDGEFRFLNEKLLDFIKSLSQSCRVLYFETDYFGGPGQQGALVCENGQMVFGPDISSEIGPINRALAHIGVVAGEGKDAFDTIELWKNRTNDDWLGIEEPVGPGHPFHDFVEHRQTAYAWTFLALGIAVCFIAFTRRGWWLLLLWLAFNFFAYASAYGGRTREIFWKRDGRLPLSSKLLHLPFLICSGAIWHVYVLLSRERPFDRVTDDIIVGRRLRAGELPPGIVNVVDLTAEMEDPAEIREKTNYVSLPILDAYHPTPDELHAAIEKLKPGPTYIHCAQGHGRTALFAIALLAERGMIQSFEQGLDLLKKARPGIGLNRVQRQFTGDYVAAALSVTKQISPN
ncbi:MAG: hypothetical protein ABFD69_02135 [Candidatus Sumerlaeia bacterium]